jgi:hypothetical protein
MADVLAQEDTNKRNQSSDDVQEDTHNIHFEEKSEFLKS